MIKLVCFLRRRPGMSGADFHRHWLESHGPLIAGTPELARHIVRYEQNHRLDGDQAGPPGDGDFDGATVQWLDSMQSFRAFVEEPAYAELVAPDEQRFLDRGNLIVLFTHEEEVIIDGGDACEEAPAKLLCLLRRRAGLAPEAFHEHWRGRHAGLFRDTPELARHITAYHQSHRTERDRLRAESPAAGDRPSWDGLAEQWFESREAFEAMVAEPAYAERVVPDEDAMIDREALRFFLSGPPDVIIG